MLNKKQIQVIFLFKFKISHKAAETTLNNTFGPGTANGHTVQRWFKNFAKEMRVWTWGVQWLAMGSDSKKLRGSSKLMLLRLHEKLLKNTASAILWLLGWWSKVERWKSSISGYLMNWPQIKSIVILKYHLLLFYVTTVNNFSSDCDMQRQVDFIWQLARTSSVAGLRRNSKVLPKAKLAPEQDHGHCLMVCCQSDPWQLSESRWNHYIEN